MIHMMELYFIHFICLQQNVMEISLIIQEKKLQKDIYLN